MDRRRAAGALLALAACIACSAAAPTASNHTALDLYEGPMEGCYYNFQRYGEGDRIMTNEPCLNCTCHNHMLMCYLRVCPFTKPIGQDCTVEKRADQCCPIVTCPDVPVDLLTSTSTSSPAEYGGTGVGKLDKYGCSINGKYLPEGSKVPPTPNKPCEHCYCIRNMTTCVMQECTLHVDGCTPIYHKDVCCPVRYSCDHPEDEIPLLDDMTTTVRPTPGFLLTTTTLSPVTQTTQDCVHDDQIFPDGALIKTEKACEHCYCMKGDIVCVVQECGTPMENEGKNCTSLPPREGQCCPDTYICEGDELPADLSTQQPTESFETTSQLEEQITTLTPPRRVSIEGSGYRNEPDMPSYTEIPTFDSEIEGSGEEQKTETPIVSETSVPEKETPIEDISTSTETHRYTTESKLGSEKTTTEPDKGLNTVPIGTSEDEFVEPSVPETTRPSENVLTTEPIIIIGEQQTVEDKIITTVADYQPSSVSDTSISREDEFIITTEPTFRKEDEGSVPTVQTLFTEPTIAFKDEVTSKFEQSATPSVATTKLPKYTDEVKETVPYKESSTESYLIHPTFEPASTHEQEVISESVTTTINPILNEIDDETSHPGRIPGEGDCLLNGITYKNNSSVPNTNNCHSSCKCISSIVKCDPIICSPPPEYMDNCQPMYDTPESCCPTYICDHAQETIPPQPHSQMSGTESPLSTPSFECAGDQCQVTQEKEVPSVTPEKCSPTDNCLTQSSEKPEITGCGPHGCDEIQTPGYPVEVQPEKCTGPECVPSSESCAEGNCQYPPSSDKCEGEGGCEVSPVKPCVGEDCIKQEIEPSKNIPQLCENEKECQGAESSEAQHPHCEGESCLEDKIDCKDNKCISHQLPTQTTEGEKICTDESNCRLPIEEGISEECTEDSCRRKQIAESETTLPSACSSNECLQEKPISSTEKPTDIDILSTASPFVEKLTTVISDTSVSEHFTEPETLGTKKPEKIEHEESEFSTTETIDLVTKKPFSTSDSITTEVHPEIPGFEPSVSEQPVVKLSTAPEPEYEHSTDKQLQSETPKLEETVTGIPDSSKPEYIEPELDRSTSESPASEQSEYDKYPTSEQYERETVSPDKMEHEVTKEPSSEQTESDITVTKQPKPEISASEKTKLVIPTTEIIETESSASETPPSEQYDSKIPELEVSTVKQTELEALVTEKAEPEVPFTLQTEFETQTVKATEVTTSELLETSTQAKLEEDEFVPVQVEPGTLAPEISASEKPKITVTLQPEIETTSERLESELPVSVHPVTEISKHPDIQTSSSESYGTQQPELVTEKSETTVAEQHIRETTVSEHKQETSTSKYSETESYTEATPASKQHELELHTEAIPASEQPQPEISTLEEHQSQPPKSEQFESTTATLEQFELETPVTDQPLPESSGPEQTKPEISVPKQPVSEIPAPEDAKPNILTTEQYEIQTVRPERVESDSSTIKQVELESSTTPEQAQSGTTVPEQLELETQAPEYAKPETLAPVEYESRAPSSEQTGTEAPEPERTEPATILPERIEPQTLAPELLTTEQPEHAHEIDQHKQFEESDTGLPEASTGPAKQDVTLIEPGKQTTELFEKTTEQQLYFESSVTDKTMPSVTDKDLTKLPVTAYIGSQEITTKLSIESATSLPDVTESKGITGHHEVSVEESSEAVTKAVEIPTTPVIEQDHTEGLQVTEAQEIRTTISEEFNLEITTKSPEHVYPGKETATEYPQYHATKSEAQPDKETGSPVLPVTESKVPDAVTPVEEGITTKLPEEIIKEQEISTQNAVTIPSVETTTLTEEVEKTITEQEKGPEIKATEHSITEVPAFDVEVPERGTTKVPEETLTDQTLETKAPEEISEISTVTTDMHKKFSTELPMSHVSIFVESVTKPEEQGEIRTELPIKPEEINTSTPEISVSVEETKTEHPQHITTQEYVTKAPESIVTKEKEIHTESSITEFEKPSTTVQYDEIRTEPTKSSDIVIHDFVTKTSESPEEEKKTTEIPDLSVKPQESTSIVPEHIDEQESSTVSLQKYSPEEEEQRTELPSTLEPEQKHSEYITTGIKETSTVPSISEELKTEQTKTPILLHTEGVEPPATSETETITKSPIAGTSVSTVKEEIGTATLKTTETETSKPYVTGQEEKTTISAFTEQEIRTDQEPSVTESYTKVSGEEVFQTKVPENIVTEVQSITTIISDTSGTEKYGVTVEAPKISSTTSLSDTATELPGTFVTKEESQTETYLITHHDISTELPEILTQEKITTRTPDVEFSTQGPEIFTIGDQEKEPHAITTERSEEYVTRVQEKTSANIPEDQKTQPQQITAVTPELSVYEIPEISTKVPETGLSDVQESYTHEEEKITEIPVAFITEQTLTTKIAEFSTEEQKKYTKQPEVMSHVTEPQEESTEKEELITKLPDMYLTTSRTEVTESSKTPESFTKQEEIQTVSSEETSTKIPELYVTEAHKVATEFSETPDIKQDTITKLPVEIGSQQPVTQLDVVEPDLETSTKTEEAYEEKQTEATSPRLPELSTVSQEELTQEHGIVTKSPERETIAPELETDITDQRPSTELPESFTKLPEEPESTSEHIHESSETTPYLVELEEHTHKIEEEIGTTLSTEMISTKYPKLPAVQDKLPEATDKTDTEKQTKMPAKEDDTEKTSTPIEGVFTTDLYHTSSSSSTESSALSEETTKQQIDRETTPSVSAHEDKETKVSTAPTETPFIQDTQVTIQPEKETETSTEKIFETTSSEKEIKPSTTEVTTSKAEEVSTQASPVYDKYTKPVSETLPSTMKPEIPKPGLNEIQPTDDIPLPEDEGHFPTSGTGGYGQEPDYVEEDQAFGPGTCRYGGKVYVSAQQIPRDDPCDFCFCFRSDIICLQQSCPPPIHGCHEEPIQGFCCPRYECPVSMATTLNVTTTTTTTTTTLPPHFLPHAYKGAAQRKGCLIKGHTYKVGEVVRSSSGPCLHCTCGGDGQMKCDPKACTPEPMLRQMIAAAVSAKRRR